MKNISLQLCLIFLSTLSLFGQENFTTSEYPIYKSKIKNYGNTIVGYQGVIGSDSMGYYTSHQETVPVLTRYNHSLEIEAEEDIIFNKGHFFANLQFIDITFFNDTLFLFYSESKMRESYLWVRTIDKKTLKLNNDERLLDTITHVKGFYPKFNIIQSIERNSLLVVSRIDAHWNNTASFGFRVYQNGLNLVWGKDETIQYNNQLPDNIEMVIDELANVHVLIRIYETTWLNHVLTDDTRKNEYAVLSYTANGQKSVMHNITIDDKFIRDLNIFAGSKGSYIISGFYSDRIKYGAEGVFISSNMPDSRAQRPILRYPFRRDLMEYLLKSHQIDKGQELFQLRTNNIRVLENGNIIVTAQRELMQDYDNMNDILVFCFSPSGDYLWDRVIPKRQSGFDHTSYLLVTHPQSSQIKILFNENPKNDFSTMYSRDMKTYGFPGPYYIRVVSIDENGNMEQARIHESDRRDPVPLPKYYFDMRDGNIILSARYYNEYQLMHLDLFSNY